MRRIEPTIGSVDTQTDPAADALLSKSAKSRSLRKSIKEWAVTIALLVSTVVLSYGGASYAGLLPDQLKFGAPKLVERLLIIVGFLVVFGSQLVGALLLFRSSFERGLLTLLFPGYLLIALKRSGIFWPIMGPWCVGIFCIVIGTVLLT